MKKKSKMVSIDASLMLLTAKEAARRLCLTFDQFRELVETGRMPQPRRIGACVRFVASEIAEHLKSLPSDRITWSHSGPKVLDPRSGRMVTAAELAKRAATRHANRQQAILLREHRYRRRRETAAIEQWSGEKVAAFRALLSVMDARSRALSRLRAKMPLPLP